MTCGPEQVFVRLTCAGVAFRSFNMATGKTLARRGSSQILEGVAQHYLVSKVSRVARQIVPADALHGVHGGIKSGND